MLIEKQDQLLRVINQVFELEKKSNQKEELIPIRRNLARIKDAFTEMGLAWNDPLGEAYSDTRTDCEASIAGDSTDNLQITEVIKPIVWMKDGTTNYIIQKGVVIAESRK